MVPYKVGHQTEGTEGEPAHRPTLYTISRQPFGYAVCRDGAVVRTGCTLLEAENVVACFRELDGTVARAEASDSLVVYLEQGGSFEQMRRG
jgi:hypothetical protein